MTPAWPGGPVLLLMVLLLPVAADERCRRAYVASPVEQFWVANIAKWPSKRHRWPKGCAAWKEHKPLFDVWLAQLAEHQTRSAPLNETVFSYHTINCPGAPTRKSYLEPLAVSLRHPYFPCADPKAQFFDTSFLAFPFAADVPHTHAYFFDVGSTYFDTGIRGSLDSLAWFMGSYAQRGFHFAHIYAWEIKQIDHTAYWQRVPNAFKPRMHFFNTAASANETSGMNPLRIVEWVAKPEDYVVFKLDIDNNEVEVSLILQLLHSPKLIRLVDEVFWENHVRYSPSMWRGWGDLQNLTGPCTTLAGSYRCFQQMRQVGIRAHS
eukprot:EG_transcript_19844